ncbi:MAG: hypothetical protein N2505_00060 [Endomicrobia bacterium]|nr:hypothetical protein [Endomicrobiia bacterium]
MNKKLEIKSYEKEIEAVNDLCYIFSFKIQIETGFIGKDGTIPVFVKIIDIITNKKYDEYYGSIYETRKYFVGQKGRLLTKICETISESRNIDFDLLINSINYHYSTFATCYFLICKLTKNTYVRKYILVLSLIYNKTKNPNKKLRLSNLARKITKTYLENKENEDINLYKVLTRCESFEAVKIII